MASLTLRLLVLGLLATVWMRKVDGVKPFYRHFDDYLTSLSRKRSGNDERIERNEGAFKHRNVVTRGTAASPSRRNMPCCILGELAGDKGFHCYVDYYAARIAMRNRNRAHNRKLGFYGRYRSPNYGHHLMKTFERCVAGQGTIFHKCCHLATLERRDGERYRVRSNRSKDKHSSDKNATVSEEEEEELQSLM